MEIVKGTTGLYIIVGHPIAQVKSPEVFNSWFKGNGIDSVMIPLDVGPDGMASFVETFRHSENMHGVIITIPYKAMITRYIDKPSAQVTALGAANIIRCTSEGKIEGDMVDGKGFFRALSNKGVSAKNSHVFIIGCGGAGSAVAWEALEQGAGRVSLLDIDRNKAGDLAASLKKHFSGQEVIAVLDPPEKFDIVMNATPIGMNSNDPLPMQIDKIPEGAAVADAVTSPPVTLFLEKAKKRGHLIQSGPEMVAGQAPLIAEYFGIKGFPESA